MKIILVTFDDGSSTYLTGFDPATGEAQTGDRTKACRFSNWLAPTAARNAENSLAISFGPVKTTIVEV